MNLHRFLENVLRRTGGWYLILAVALAQMASNIVAIPISIITQINTGLTDTQALQANTATLGLTLLGNLIVWLVTYIRNRSAHKRLQQWKKGLTLTTGSSDELQAWRQVTSMGWNYAIVASAVALIVIILPLQLYQINAFNMTSDQVVYTVFGGLISILTIITLDVMVLERLLSPARTILLPRDFQTQISGAGGMRIFAKTQVLIVAMIGIGIMLVAPIGYHQTYKVLYEAIGSATVLYDLRSQSILVSIFGVLIGMVIAYMLSTSISRPVEQMIKHFRKIEEGDLSQRIRVDATDEIGELSVYFNRMISRLDELQTSLEQQVSERTAQLTATLEVGRVASQILDQNELISTVVNVITEKFGHYYAAIFMIDSTGRWAELRAATGDAGKLLLESKHRLEIGGKSMVSACITGKQARIALDVGQEATRFNNPLLPYTRSEIALPLKTGDRVIGALDVQSTIEAAFGESDIETLQGLANQVSVAVENARLFAETQQNLDEIRSVHRQYLSSAWIQSTTSGSIDASYGETQPSENTSELDVALTLRDQIIGQITLEGDDEWSADERILIEAIANQAALALENARLVEESQQLAFRERLISEIGAKIWASTTIDSVLQTSIREIGRIMNASEAMIEIDVPENNQEIA